MSPAPSQTFDQAPFDGMRDSLDPTTSDARKALLLQNCYAVPGPDGSEVVGRPGFTVLGAQLGAGATRRVQGFHQYTKVDGTELTVAFCGGLMYTLNWTTRVWTNVALVGVSLSTTAKVRCVTFADVMVVSDGVNRPWTYDGTTFVDLTNAPVAYGPPTVFYAKLFLIKNADRRTMVWSEENAPNTGYEAGGFANAWTLAQTGSAGLERLLGTNEALYYWRARSTGRITGTVTPDFVSAGTREGVSDTIGTTAPDAVTIYDDIIYFLSADGQPFALPTAGSLIDLWKELRETSPTWPRAQLAKAQSVILTDINAVLIGVPGANQTEMTSYVALRHPASVVMGLWDGWTATAMGVVKDASGNMVFLHGTANGYAYDHGRADGTYWDNAHTALDGGPTGVAHTVTGTPLGYSVQHEKMWDRLDATFRLDTDLTAVQFDYETPRGQRAPLLLDLTGVGAAMWDVSLWDEGRFSAGALERQQSIGLAGYGRWMRPRWRHQVLGERLGLVAIAASGFLQPGEASRVTEATAVFDGFFYDGVLTHDGAALYG